MRRAFFVFHFCVMLVATGAMGLRAQSDTTIESEPFHLSDTIVVTANRFISPIRTIGSAITIITAEQIIQSQAAMASDLLRTVPGISIVRAGGDGQQTSLFMRGANSEHVLVLIDGVELNDPSTPSTAANLANLPTDNIERIEILRGPQSVLYGSDAVGGVVQIFTKRAFGKMSVALNSELGSRGTFRENLTVRAGQEKVDYSVSLSRHDTDGLSAAAENRGNTEADGYDNTTISANLGIKATNSIELRLAGQLTEADAELDQAGGILDDPNYTLNSKERQFGANLTHRPERSIWSQRVGFSLVKFERTAQDITDPAHSFDSSLTSYDGQRLKIDWQHMLKFESIGYFTFGLESEREEMNQSLFYESEYFTYTDTLEGLSERTTGLYGLAELSLMPDWHATLGVRSDKHDKFGSEPTYRVTTAYLLDQARLKLRATYGTSFKAPSLVQLHDDATGNPDLKPETSEGWEVGVESRLVNDRLSFGVTYFHTSFTDLIQYDGVMSNVASASIRGGEIFASFETPGLAIRIDYTNTLTGNDANPGEALLRRPRHKLNLSATGDLTDRLAMILAVSHKGRRADLDFSTWPAERVVLMDYTTVDLGATYQLSPSVGFHARVENLLDAEYEEVLYYGSAPRGVFVGINLSN